MQVSATLEETGWRGARGRLGGALRGLGETPDLPPRGLPKTAALCPHSGGLTVTASGSPPRPPCGASRLLRTSLCRGGQWLVR